MDIVKRIGRFCNKIMSIVLYHNTNIIEYYSIVTIRFTRLSLVKFGVIL